MEVSEVNTAIKSVRTVSNHYFTYCSNVTYVFKSNQIDDCELRRVGNLSFQMMNGDCTGFITTDSEEVFLCPTDRGGRYCHRGEEPLGPFIEVNYSIYDHINVEVGASGGLFAFIIFVL